MYFIQFYNRDSRGLPIEACGDRSVVIFDGRENKQSIGKFAEKECLKRGFKAWSIHKGESFTMAALVSGIHAAYVKPEDKTAQSATYGA